MKFQSALCRNHRSERKPNWLVTLALTDFGQSCTLLMVIAFAFIVLCESSGIYRQTVKLTECQRDGMTGGRMPEHNTSHDGRIIRLRQVKKRKFIQVRYGLE